MPPGTVDRDSLAHTHTHAHNSQEEGSAHVPKDLSMSKQHGDSTQNNPPPLDGRVLLHTLQHE